MQSKGAHFQKFCCHTMRSKTTFHFLSSTLHGTKWPLHLKFASCTSVTPHANCMLPITWIVIGFVTLGNVYKHTQTQSHSVHCELMCNATGRITSSLNRATCSTKIQQLHLLLICKSTFQASNNRKLYIILHFKLHDTNMQAHRKGEGVVASAKCEAQAQIFRHAPDLTVRP